MIGVRIYVCEKAPALGTSPWAPTLLPPQVTHCPWCCKPVTEHPRA